MPVRSKSIYEPASADDGLRVLVTRYWPRGVSRGRVDVYNAALAPSRELLRAFKDGVIDWETYEPRYLDEMSRAAQSGEIAGLAETARSATVTVMCVCRDEAQCHRRLLRGLLERELAGAS